MSFSKNSPGTKTDNHNCANTRMLSRILIVLSESKKKLCQEKIFRSIVGSKNNLKDALLWMTNHKIIIKEKLCSREMFVYFISPKYKELFNE